MVSEKTVTEHPLDYEVVNRIAAIDAKGGTLRRGVGSGGALRILHIRQNADATNLIEVDGVYLTHKETMSLERPSSHFA